MVKTLDSIDMKILFELDKSSRISDSALAKIVNRSKESVRYRLARLKKQGILNRFYIWIDPSKLGYNSYKLYLKLANKPDEREKLIEMLKREKKVFWLGSADGAWDLGITFFAKSNRDFYDLQNKISSKFSGLILKKYTGMLVEVMACSKDFFWEDGEKIVTRFFNKDDEIELGDVDKIILAVLQQNSRASFVDLARKSGVSIDVVRYRMKKFIENKIIARYVCEINYNLLGYEFFKTFLYTNNFSKANEKELVSYVKRHPNIVHMVRQISPWDVELEIIVTSYLEYNKIINELKEKFVDVIVDVESAIMSEDYVYPSKKLIFE